jgi:hypothetical protein
MKEYKNGEERAHPFCRLRRKGRGPFANQCLEQAERTALLLDDGDRSAGGFPIHVERAARG